MKIWEIRKGHILYTLYGHDNSVNSINFSKEGDLFCSGGDDGIVMLWQSNLHGNMPSSEMERLNEEMMISKKSKKNMLINLPQNSKKVEALQN